MISLFIAHAHTLILFVVYWLCLPKYENKFGNRVKWIYYKNCLLSGKTGKSMKCESASLNISTQFYQTNRTLKPNIQMNTM